VHSDRLRVIYGNSVDGRKNILLHPLILAACVSACLIIAACAASGQTRQTAEKTESAATETAATKSAEQESTRGASTTEPSPAAEKPAKLILGIAQDFDTLDPNKAVAAGTQEVIQNMFHGLINITPGGEIIPELSESYEISDDLMKYTFKIRKGVKFHNGKALTPGDVAYTYRRYIGKTDDQATPINEAMTKLIAGVEATDGETVEFTLSAPSAAFISICISPIIPEGSGPIQADSPTGTGPYRFKSYSPGINLEMTRFEDYYGKKPEFADVEVKIFTNVNAGHLALQNDEIHIMKLESTTPAYDKTKLKLIKQSQNMVQLLAFNHEFPPFRDIRVRRALNHAVDKEMIIEMLSPGSLQLDTNISPVMKFFYDETLLNYYPYDPDKAKQLLSEAGYGDGALAFTVKAPAEYQFHIDTAQIIKQQFAEVGVNMDIEIVEWSSWLSEVYEKRDHESTIIGLTGKADPGDILMRQTSDYYRNFGNYKNPKYDALISAAASVGDLNKRAQLYKEAERALADDAAHIYIMDPANNILMDKHIVGYTTYPIPYIDLRLIGYDAAAAQ